MPDELDVLIKTLQQQRTDLEVQQMSVSNREQECADLVNTLQRLRKKSAEIDETWRKHQANTPR